MNVFLIASIVACAAATAPAPPDASLWTPARQQSRHPVAWERGTWELGMLAGYARGKVYDVERTPVELFQAVLRAGFHFGPTGSGRLRGNFAIVAEGLGLWIDQDNHAGAAGLNLLARYTWATRGRWRPLVAGGAGLLYSNIRIPAGVTQRNFTPQLGVGVQYLHEPRFAITAEYRYHHLSNKGATETNPGINSHLVLVGFSWFR